MKRADVLNVGLSIHDKQLEVEYQIDKEFRGVISVDFPFEIAADLSVITTSGLWISVFLGQLCLSREIRLQFPIIEGMLEDLTPVITSLYDIRCYRNDIALVEAPIITADTIPARSSSRTQPTERRACTLWSGGTDSTLALILLMKNGYDVIPLHFDINVDVKEIEEMAVSKLSNQLGLPVKHIKVAFPDFITIATLYSDSFAIPPLENSIPHGRELLLFPPALIIASQFNIHYLCPAHENEVWTAQVSHEGKLIWRWDTQSEAMSVVLDNFVSKYVESPLHIFSPTSPITDFNKFAFLLFRHPELLENMSACYWDSWCGECIKCVRYYLYQRALNHSVVQFLHDPVVERNRYLQDYIYSWRNRELPYWTDVQYALYTIVDKHGVALEPLLEDYKKSVYPHIAEEMPKIRNRVFEMYPAKLLPPKWDSQWMEIISRKVESQIDLLQ
jgi:7-cyano-7-deazaguanine synthase in queuosine biosynthesis